MKTEALLKRSRQAFLKLSQLSTDEKNTALEVFARLIEENKNFLLKENAKDLKREEKKLSVALYQRLKLDEGKISQIVQGLRDLAKLPDPANRVLAETLLDDGLILQKVSVPLGVVGIIFESRPDVIPQVLSLMLKSGNAVVLKGGSEALNSNAAFMKLLAQLQKECRCLPAHWAQLVQSRKAVHEILNYPQYVNLIIPRGSNALVQSIMSHTKIPVMGHADGVCHLYVDQDADLEKALALTLDSKAQYPSACNAIETVLVHKKVAKEFLPMLKSAAKKMKVELRSSKKNFGREFGDLILAVKTVNSLDDAIDHIHRYGSAHTDAIVSKNSATIETFLNHVDSAGVFANASTRFADGFRYGFCAEVGISTGKLHARGPVGLDGLVIYKYKLRGAGQCVSDYAGANPKRKFKHIKKPT